MNGKTIAYSQGMEKQKTKELIRLDAERSKAELLGDTKKYLSAIGEISKTIRAADRNKIS